MRHAAPHHDAAPGAARQPGRSLAGCLLLWSGCAPSAGERLWSDPVPHDSDAFLFSAERVNRIELNVDEEAAHTLAAQGLHTDPRAEVRGSVTIDGEELPDVGLRLRGRLGSFQPTSRKSKWMLDFNEYVDDRRFVGLKGLALNNADEDCTFLREATALAAFRDVGVPAPRVGFAQVFFNGEDKGLYVLVEPEDDLFLQRMTGSDDGALYDGGYVLRGAFPLRLDLGEGQDELFELEEGADPGGSLARVSRGVQLARLVGGLATLGRDVDWEEFSRHLAVEAWAAHTDGYAIGRNNVRYWLPAGGPLQLLPWDLDLAFCDPEHDRFLCDTSLERWEEPVGNLAHACLADPACRPRLADIAEEVADTLDTSALVERFDALAALTEAGVASERWSRCSPEERTERRATLRRWLESGGDRLRGLWR